MEYDFKALSDYDFELLVCDLLSAWLGRRVENFRRGRDQGIDLRYASDSGGKVVVQCKHYANTSFSGLRAAVGAECEKIRRLRPRRYLLVTSRFLTPAEKDKLFRLLAPYCPSEEDILGGNELNTLLRRYPEVEQAHYKLWLTSTAMLEKILHSEIYRQSVIFQTEIQDQLRIYVQSRTAYSKAREMLSRFNCCIISGIPGIGKTTLAKILLIHYLDKGYEIVKVRADIGEALKAYHPDRRQIFLYDDFLGSTSLEMKSNKNEGGELLSFLGHVARQSGKKIILTTREYILNQARQTDENFAREDFDYQKCVISLEDYTRADRARILYNHLFFRGVSKADIQDLLEGDRVIKIVDHPNYSPRLIETVIKLRRPAGEGGFYRFFFETLNHPGRLWETAFCRQISPAARDLILLLCTDEVMQLEGLRRRYEVYHARKAVAENRALYTGDFMDALRETEGTFIRIDRSCVSYHNPSVRDFIHGYIRENEAEFRMLCETAGDFNFCVRLADLEPALCQKYEELFMTALRGTAGGEARDFILAERIQSLAAVCPRLQSDAAVDLLRQMVERLLSLLEKAWGELSADTWSSGMEPRDLRSLLDVLSFFEDEPGLKDRTFDVCFRYATAWFEWACLYMPEDFLLFQRLWGLRPFPVERDSLRRVYDALEDYCDELADGDIQEMVYEGECERYWRQIEDMAEFFEVNLYGLLTAVEDRMWELEQEAEEEDEDDGWSEDAPSRLEDRELIDMFQGLLEREGEDLAAETP